MNIFLAHFGPPSTKLALFKLCSLPLPSIVGYHVHTNVTTVHPSCFQQDNAPCHKAKVMPNLNIIMSLLYLPALQSHRGQPGIKLYPNRMAVTIQGKWGISQTISM